MGSSLLNNRNSLYFQQANRLTGNPDKVQVLVENLKDVPVWYKILSKAAPEKVFDISPFNRNTKAQCKGAILGMADSFGPYFIGCVDSDYDWLLENHTHDGLTIRNNNYILQTYAYAVENLSLQPYSFVNIMVDSTLSVDEHINSLDKDFQCFILEVSRSVYPVLLWHLIFKKQDKLTDRQKKELHYIFKPGNYDELINEAGAGIDTKRSKVLKRFQISTTELVKKYEQDFPDKIENVNVLKTELASNYNLTPENAYLFVRGHDLQDFMHYVFFNPILDLLLDNQRSKIINFSKKINRQNIFLYFKKNRLDFKTLQERAVDFINDESNPLWIKLQDDIRRAIN